MLKPFEPPLTSWMPVWAAIRAVAEERIATNVCGHICGIFTGQIRNPFGLT